MTYIDIHESVLPDFGIDTNKGVQNREYLLLQMKARFAFVRCVEFRVNYKMRELYDGLEFCHNHSW